MESHLSISASARDRTQCPSWVRIVAGKRARKSAEGSAGRSAPRSAPRAAGDVAAAGGSLAAARGADPTGFISSTLADNARFRRTDSGQTANVVPFRICFTFAPSPLPRSVGTQPVPYRSIQPSSASTRFTRRVESPSRWPRRVDVR